MNLYRLYWRKDEKNIFVTKALLLQRIKLVHRYQNDPKIGAKIGPRQAPDYQSEKMSTEQKTKNVFLMLLKKGSVGSDITLYASSVSTLKIDLKKNVVRKVSLLAS